MPLVSCRHHFELRPARRYGKADLVRLHRVQALKLLRYSLAEIRAALDDPNLNPFELIDRQVRTLEKQEQQARQLSGRLRDLSKQISTVGEASASDWLDLLEMTAIYQRHLTADELQVLHNPKGRTRRDIDAQWAELSISSRKPCGRVCRRERERAGNGLALGAPRDCHDQQ
jgi:DNA-binding transcriptional MerR regulator